MTEKQRPNLLYIHSDQHCPTVAGCYGDPLAPTPNLDRLAQSGVTLSSAYCPSPICVPSRMSALTGRHPYQNRVWTNEHALDPAIPTLAHAMGAAGYQPAIVGRMHAIGPDQLHGYVERLVGDHSSNHLGGAPVDRGALNGTAGPDRISLRRSGAGQSAYQVHDEVVTAAAVDWIRRFDIARRAGVQRGPLNLTVGYMLPHPPYVARRADYELYRERMSLPRKPAPAPERDHPYLRWWRGETGIQEVNEDEVLRARSAYWGLVTRLDAMIGQLIDALREAGLLENTLIVYTSDHGDMLGEHGLWWKHTFYDESARVPLILSWPGTIPAAQRCDRVVSALDLTATLLDALGAPALPNAVGRSFMSLLTGGSESRWDDEAFSEYCSDEYGPPGGCYQRMVRREEWKLVYYYGQEPQLFNLREDPDELVDRAADPACATIRRELTARVLDGWDAERIRATMAARQADNRLLRAWARNTHPPEQYRWPLLPEMNVLDQDR